MLTRTRHKKARFVHSFWLDGLKGPQPPGEYDIDEDEQLVEGLDRVSYRRVATFIHVPSGTGCPPKRDPVRIEHAALKAALQRDRESAVANDN